MTGPQRASKPVQVSFLVMALALLLVGWLQIATLLVAALFSYLALSKLHFNKTWTRWVAVGLFLILVSGAVYGLAYFVRHTVQSLPEIADKAIPSVIEWAKTYNLEMPFTDYDSLKDLALDEVSSQVHYLGSVARVARGAGSNLLFMAAGIVVAIGLFLNPALELRRESHRIQRNLYSICCDEIAARFRTLYESFETVMGAQILISAINTVFTAIFALAVHLPYAVVIIGVTFLCGLLPVIGNLISNTIIVSIGFTVSPRMALTALIFLIVIHKLEYFLNSKIVGDRIRNPLWLTLVGLVVGEKLMGIPGMILAPVILNYIKLETTRIRVLEPEGGIEPGDPMRKPQPTALEGGSGGAAGSG
jgi:predicted PurR-regulated permease PerM